MDASRKISIIPNTPQFELFQQICKQVQYPQDTIYVNAIINNRPKVFKLMFDWQDENICGTEIYEMLSGCTNIIGENKNGEDGNIQTV